MQQRLAQIERDILQSSGRPLPISPTPRMDLFGAQPQPLFHTHRMQSSSAQPQPFLPLQGCSHQVLNLIYITESVDSNVGIARTRNI